MFSRTKTAFRAVGTVLGVFIFGARLVPTVIKEKVMGDDDEQLDRKPDS